MSLPNFHTHTTFCDGKNTAEEMVTAAIERGCTELGFSTHGHMDFADWSISLENTERYKEEILRLKEKYRDRIKIYLGIEYDYFCDFPTDDYDYVIGAVHYVEKDGNFLAVDHAASIFCNDVEKYYNGDFYAYAHDYYKLVGDLYNKTRCDIIAHFDLVTKFNQNDILFDTTDHQYRKYAGDALDALLETPAVFEVNTGAISRGYRKEPYPADFILDKIWQCGKIPVISSDTHAAATVNFMIEETAADLAYKGIPCCKSLAEVLRQSRGFLGAKF